MSKQFTFTYGGEFMEAVPLDLAIKNSEYIKDQIGSPRSRRTGHTMNVSDYLPNTCDPEQICISIEAQLTMPDYPTKPDELTEEYMLVHELLLTPNPVIEISDLQKTYDPAYRYSCNLDWISSEQIGLKLPRSAVCVSTPDYIEGISQLSMLKTYHGPILSSTEFPPTLETLYTDHIDGENVNFSGLTNLKTFTASDARVFPDILKLPPTVTSLNLSYDTPFKTINWRDLSSLKRLSVLYNRNVTVLDKLPMSLTTLDLSNSTCSNVNWHDLVNLINFNGTSAHNLPPAIWFSPAIKAITLVDASCGSVNWPDLVNLTYFNGSGNVNLPGRIQFPPSIKSLYLEESSCNQLI